MMIVHAIENRLAVCSGFKHQQQFPALPVNAHDVHLAHMLQLPQGQGDVEHGCQFDDDALCLGQQRRQQGGHIGRTVLKEHNPVSLVVASCRVKKDGASRPVDTLMKKKRGIGLHHIGLHTQQGEIVLGNSAQQFLPFDIGGMLHTACHIRKIHSQSAGKVDERVARHK